MHELKRKEKITEQLKIGDEVLSITIVPEDIARDYNKAIGDIVKAQAAIKAAQKESTPDTAKIAIEQYGQALIQLTSILLGEENTQKILAFYEHNYVEMGVGITPFLITAIKPKIDKAVADMRIRARETYRKAGFRK